MRNDRKIQNTYRIDVPYPTYKKDILESSESKPIVDELSLMESGQIVFLQVYNVLFFQRKLNASKM